MPGHTPGRPAHHPVDAAGPNHQLRDQIRYGGSWDELHQLAELVDTEYQAGRLTLTEAEDRLRQIAREARRVAADQTNVPASAFLEPA